MLCLSRLFDAWSMCKWLRFSSGGYSTFSQSHVNVLYFPHHLNINEKILRSFGMCIPHWFLCLSKSWVHVIFFLFRSYLDSSYVWLTQFFGEVALEQLERSSGFASRRWPKLWWHLSNALALGRYLPPIWERNRLRRVGKNLSFLRNWRQVLSILSKIDLTSLPSRCRTRPTFAAHQVCIPVSVQVVCLWKRWISNSCKQEGPTKCCMWFLRFHLQPGELNPGEAGG